ncbi:MAG TPA: hypothetical protein VGR87_04990 [Candidatus Limnocylindria bacterium]|jgi:hypothetical protein|nr:hypothetical protein [Candidatus Limnocylindria bacterium]
MFRFFVVVTAAVLLSVSVGNAALARGTLWCAVDPVLLVNGRMSDVQVVFDQSQIPNVLPPVTFRFHVPSNATATVTMPASTVPYTVEVLYDLASVPKKGDLVVTVETLVRADAVFQTQTSVRMAKGVFFAVSGWSGSTTVISYTLK